MNRRGFIFRTIGGAAAFTAMKPEEFMARRRARTVKIGKVKPLKPAKVQKWLAHGHSVAAKMHREMKPMFIMTESELKLRLR